MPIVRDKTTGKQYEVDNEGNVLRTIDVGKAASEYGAENDPTRVAGYQDKGLRVPPRTISEEETRQTRANAIPLVTGALGSLVGGPAGGGVAAFGGSMLAQELQSRFPKTFGTLSEEDDTPRGAIVKAGVEGVTNYLGDKVSGFLGAKGGKIKDEISNWLMRSRLLGGDALDPEVKQFLRDNPDFPITHGQATGNKITQFLEANLGGTRGREIRREQQGQFRDIFQDEAGKEVASTNPERLGRRVEQGVFEGSQNWMNDVNAAFGSLRNIAKANKATVGGQPASRRIDATGKPVIPAKPGVEIEGPITTTKSYTDAKYLLDKIQADYNLDSADAFLPMLNEDQRSAFNALKRFADSAVDKSGKPIAIPLNVALDIKRITGDKAFGTIFGDLESNRLRQLNRNLDEDIRASLQTWKNGPEALRQYARGNAFFQQHAELFKETPGITGLLQGGPGTAENIKSILRDPLQLRRTLFAVDDNGQTKKALKSEFLSDIFNRAFSQAEGKFSKGTAYDLFTDRNKESTVSQLFTGEEARNLKRFFKTIDQVNTDIPYNSATSLGWSLARNGAAIGASLLPFVGGDADFGTLAQSGMILGAIIGTKQFTKNALLNPRMVRIATDLAQLPSDSYKAKALARTLFQAMRGSKVMLELANGMTAEAEINSKGEIDPSYSIPKQAQAR